MRAAIPEALGPGTADESGLVTYGQPSAPAATATRLPPEPPEALGPATETAGGGFTYGVPSSIQVVHPDKPTAAEREARQAEMAEPCASCTCAVIPGHLLSQLENLARDARRFPREGPGSCPGCRAIPARLIDDLAEVIEQARELEGAAR
jgi:hypothetical protein